MILTRYIALEVVMFVVLALLLLAGMDAVFGFIAELEDTNDGYRSLQAGFYILATLPRRLYEFFPVSVLIGALFAFGQMAQNSELVVMRAATFSVEKIITAALLAASFFAVLALVLAQWVVPLTEQFAQSYRALQQGGGDVFRMKQGNWQKDDNTLVHIAALAPNGTIFGISRFIFDDEQQLKAITFSDRGQYKEGKWHLEQTRATDFLLSTKVKVHQNEGGLSQVKQVPSTHRHYVDHLVWHTQLTPDMMQMIILQPDYLSLLELQRYASHLKLQGLSYKHFSLSFWKKIIQPVAILLMVMMALSFVFGPLRSVTMGFRMTIGLVFGMLFYYCQDFFGYSSLVFDVPPMVAAVLPLLPFSVLAWYLLQRRV